MKKIAGQALDLRLPTNFAFLIIDIIVCLKSQEKTLDNDEKD